MLLASKQNMAPPKKAKNGHLVTGSTGSECKLLPISPSTLFSKQSLTGSTTECFGRQFVRSSNPFQTESEGRKSTEGKDVFSSLLNL